jgi:hypothetical protein
MTRTSHRKLRLFGREAAVMCLCRSGGGGLFAFLLILIPRPMEVSVVLVVMRMTQKSGGEESYNVVVETIYRHDRILVRIYVCVRVVVVVALCVRRMYEAGMLCELHDNPATSHPRQECAKVLLQASL